MMPFETLPEALEANRRGGQGISYLESDQAEHSVSYRGLYDRALGILRSLQRAGLGPGDELVLLVNTNEQYVDVFWACLLGGIVPVSVGVGITDQRRQRLFRIFPLLARPCVCTDRNNLERLASFAELHDAGAVYAEVRRKTVLLDEITDTSIPGEPHAARPDDTAFIQFSSGSPSEPRGVVLTHRNLLANIAGIIEGIGMRETDSTFSWMPMTHDMGLIGFHLMPLVMNLNQTQMSTELFIRRPLSWLQQAGAKRATLLSSPNFGYRHFLKSFEPGKLDGVQLAAVRLIFNDAEPVSVALGEEFLAALAPFGLKANTLFPVYGLAEASLAVAFPRPADPVRVLTIDRHALTLDESVTFVDEADGEALRVVSVGRPIKGCRLRIADACDEELPEACLGRVQIAGANVTGGYYRDEAANQEAFTADGWLDTGDLGFMAGGELVITGRRKEVVGTGPACLDSDQFDRPTIEQLAAFLERRETQPVDA